MGKILILSIGVLFCATSAFGQCEAIGLYFDSEHSECAVTGPGFYPVELWIWVDPGPEGVMCAEFMLTYPYNTIQSAVTWNTAVISIILGDLPSGLSTCFTTCQSDVFWIAHQTIYVIDPSPSYVEVIGYPDHGTIIVADCTSGYPVHEVNGSKAYLNYDLPPGRCGFDCRGTIDVDTEPGTISPAWHLDGPGAYTHDGVGDETLIDMVPGDYTLTWGDVADWATPAPNPVIQTLADLSTMTFNGTYVEGAEVGDRMWWDDNGDGIQDPGETAMEGYAELFDSGGSLVAWTEVRFGQYSFGDLLPGDYYLEFSTITGPCFVPWDIGDDEYDSDMNWDLGRTAIFTLAAGQVDHSWDCGFSHCSAVGDSEIPDSYALLANVPNPFNPRTTIFFDLPKQSAVSLRVFDVSGRLVKVLLNGEVVAAGRNSAAWNGRDTGGRLAAAGIYFYRLEAGGYSETKRMVLVK